MLYILSMLHKVSYFSSKSNHPNPLHQTSIPSEIVNGIYFGSKSTKAGVFSNGLNGY